MNTRKLTIMTLMAIFTIFTLHVSAAFAQGRGQRQQGPPPEAYTACEGKSEGDTASFESPHGDTVTGTCAQDRNGDRLLLHPDNPPGHGKLNNQND